MNYSPLLQSVEQKVIDAGYTLLYFGPLPPPHLSPNHNHNNHNICYQASLTEALRDGCVQCCAPSIADATLSEQYPSYCLEEVCAGRHPYLQGVLVRPSSSSEEVCAFVVSDGKDIYGNIRQTITQYKAAKTRGVLGPVEDTPAAQRFRQDLLSVQDVSDFVHVTLTATHPSYQRRNLAKCLLCLDLSRWALRGRQRSFLNMAIEKRIVYHNNNNEDSGSDTPQVVYAPSLASRRLYHYFHYRDVYPKYNPQTREETWSPKEADCGRVMAVFNFVPRVVEIAEEIINEVIKIGAGESASNSRGRKRSSSPVISTLHAKRKKKI
ncbi:hypothetical protein ADEAN_000738300 [Angomonas deanei]|uniref:N-acetyltransferase domain-containing protein n=1 Tax=Angomonas deanei TaxID=59799 RepID=A0A7G2CJ45_9TRYP|nr:hypothetical protein ADEAN_000738300 [Angomonas deanei]